MSHEFFVICKECNGQHSTEDVRCVNVEENMYGEDVAYFVCPVNNEVAESRVYKS